MTASCLTRQQTSAEIKALENLRVMTRGGVLPSENVVARIEWEFPRTKAAGLARMVRARIKLNAKDFAGAAALLDASVILDHTSLGDYALFMRANALERAAKLPESRIVYEQLVNDYPSSMRARESTLRDADILMRTGAASAVPLLLKDLAAKDDAAALLLVARAHEQNGESTRALAAYRRIYFYEPAAEESAEAATALPRLGSAAWPATAAEAIARADKLYDGKRYAEAVRAYADAFARFPTTANAQTQLRRGIAALGVRKVVDGVSALNSVPAAAGETRAEALYYLAQTYARARQWDQARASVEELRRAFPNSPFTQRALVNVGQIAEDASDLTNASYFLRAAVNSFQGSAEVAQAQFNLGWLAHEAKDYQHVC
jgi:tetratricopeptide (TPR) repeat protein